ncbi:MAG TPA: quinone-dependent dihydroorotate dehydrogenase [Burkholderiales bacterium]|nr:quinone-dependent dihydroorotate dehydrogenase [Burkholderiales bacterium]
MLYALARPFLFHLDAETAHELALCSADLLARLGGLTLPGRAIAGRPVRAMGLDFPNPVGLAAGLDKNGAHIDGLATFGFGFIEVGTVTPRPQPGNPKPRLFRIPEARAIVNRMGFNNEGVDALVANVRRARYDGILGINIGKNFDTPVERAADDYVACLEKVYELASYVTINISSPNTKNLRQLQQSDELTALLERIARTRDGLKQRTQKQVPLAVKIAPDLDDDGIVAIADALRRYGIDAVIATNTTISREAVAGLPNADETGGLSGAPLTQRSTAVVRKLHEQLGSDIPIIGAGGIMSGADAADKLAAGASLVQLYSGLIYRGPDLVAEAVEATR